MSNNPPPSSTSNSTNKNVQYASTTPSVASLLNLPQVQDKKKASVMGLGLGLGMKTTPGLKPSAGLVGKPLTLGLALKKYPVIDIKKPNIESKIILTETEKVGNLVHVSKSSSSAPIHAKVEKATATVHRDNQDYKKMTAFSDRKSKSNKSNQYQSISHSSDQFDPSHWRLFVGNLGPEVSDSILLSSFQNPYPSTSKALIVRDWKTQKSKGYGFVAFKDGKEFLRALKEMQGKWIGNRQAIIKKSEHQPTFNK